jgi:hypothetical protein
MRTVSTLVGLLTLATPVASFAHRAPYWESGSLIGVSVEVEGQAAALYPAPDGSGRLYLEARRGARYAIRLNNRSHERLGVALTVDGLNVISGDRPGTWRSWFSSDPGRMYVLEPYDSVLVQGWRTSLEDIRRFTFVDEERSYAARSGKANSKMGWIEVAVYRERRPVSWWWRPDEVTGGRKEKPRPYGEGETRDRADAHKDGEEDARSRADRAAPSSPPDAAAQGRSEEKAYGAAPRPEAYPGTGWGQRTEDPAVVVAFEPERSAAERLTLRYEYAGGLRALGILTYPHWDRDRLWEREHAREGFAKPPNW